MKKPHLTVYMEAETLKLLVKEAKRLNRPKSLIAEAAILSFLTTDAAENREAAITRRLDRLNRLMDRILRNEDIALETLGLFIRHWMVATPIPNPIPPELHASGRDRYERFLGALGRRLGSAGRLSTEIAVDMPGKDASE